MSNRREHHGCCHHWSCKTTNTNFIDADDRVGGRLENTQLRIAQISSASSQHFLIESKKLRELAWSSARHFKYARCWTFEYAKTQPANSQPAQKILPYVNQPEEVTFGIPNYYASTCGACSAGCGVLVKTREGRPIKLEGNPDHPMNRGGLCSSGQASILSLYDPDRLRNPVFVTRGSRTVTAAKWSDVDAKISSQLKEVKAGSGKIRILTGTINSPSTLKLVGEFLSGFSHGSHVTFEPLSTEQIRQAQELSYGTKVLPRYKLEKADYIVSIDADFLGSWLSPVEFTKQFTAKRKLGQKSGNLSKLISFESIMSLTGANSDERYAIKAQDAAKVALSIANELVNVMKVHSLDAKTSEGLQAFQRRKFLLMLVFQFKLLNKQLKS